MITNTKERSKLFAIHVGHQLRRLMKEKGVSREQLAVRTQYGIASVDNWRKGRVMMKMDAALEVCLALDITFEELFKKAAFAMQMGLKVEEKLIFGDGK